MSPIVVLGDVNVDVLSLIKGSINFASDTTSTNRLAIGGSPCNMAAWIAHSGHRPALIADIGRDVLGDWVHEQLATRAIDTSFVAATDGRTGTCVIVVDDQGQRTMFPDFGANLNVELDDSRRQAIAEASVLVMSAYTLMRPETTALAELALTIAIESGTRVVVDAASSAPIRAWGANRVRSYLVRADLVLANDDEIQALTEDGHEAWLHTLPNVIIKHGAGGASWWSQGELHTHIPALEIDVVDTTGAGDALCGGLVAALVGHDDWAGLDDSVRYQALTQAIHTASICCQQLGAWPSAEA